jgi:hypothetical protein
VDLGAQVKRLAGARFRSELQIRCHPGDGPHAEVERGHGGPGCKLAGCFDPQAGGEPGHMGGNQIAASPRFPASRLVMRSTKE